MSAAAIAAFMVRCGLVMLFFPFSTIDKLFGFGGAVAQCRQVFPSRPVAVVVLLCSLAIEVFGSLGVVTGIADRACAFVMSGFCAMTAILYKRFWAQGDFWSGPDSKGRTLFWDFLKNLSLGAGFLLIVVGADGRGLQPFLDAPLASSHPYRSTP